MRNCAEERAPGSVLFGYELLEFADDGERIVALIRDREAGDHHTVHAQYLIAADAGKTIGSALGVRMEGPTGLAGVATVHFTADLSPWVRDNTMVTWLVRPERSELLRSALVAMGPTWGKESEEWGLHLTFAPNDPARFDEDALVPRMLKQQGEVEEAWSWFTRAASAGHTGAMFNLGVLLIELGARRASALRGRRSRPRSLRRGICASPVSTGPPTC